MNSDFLIAAACVFITGLYSIALWWPVIERIWK